ncbi:hypothetical protein FO522_15315 [Bacillus nitratireducens]|nr:hypothetical protein [Bacillus nitratireducens]
MKLSHFCNNSDLFYNRKLSWKEGEFMKKMILVQKLRENCNKSINLGHTDTITLERVRDQYGKGEFV